MRRYFTALPSEPKPCAPSRLKNSPVSNRFSACGSAPPSMSAGIADKPMRPATAAFAGAVLSIDVCITHMVEPDTRPELKSCRAQLARERSFTGNTFARQAPMIEARPRCREGIDLADIAGVVPAMPRICTARRS